MTPAAHIAETIKLLRLIQKQKRKPAAQILAKHFREARYVGAKDRREIADFTFDILRNLQKLEWWAAQIEGENNNVKEVSERKIILLAMVFLKKYSLAGIQNMFSGANHHPDPLVSEEKEMLQAILGKDIIDEKMPENVQAECPEIFASSLQKKFGKDFISVMSSMTVSAPTDCRIHSLRAKREVIIQIL